MKKWMSIICLGFVVTGVILGRNGLQSQAAELKQPEKIEIMAEEKLAAKDGFRVINGKTYYYRNGKRVKGWLRLSNGAGRYFDSRTGAMKLGFARVGGKWYYFEPRNGMVTKRNLDSEKRQCPVFSEYDQRYGDWLGQKYEGREKIFSAIQRHHV